MSELFGEIYSVDPRDVRFDPSIANVNARKTEAELVGLVESIKRSGQIQPIYMRNSLCGDGINRVEACKRLGIHVLCTDVPATLDDLKYKELCNANTWTGRNLNASQKAIHAYELTKIHNLTDREALLRLSMNPESKLVGFVRYIDCSRVGRELDIINKIRRDELVMVDGKTTKSIEVAKKMLCKYEKRLLEESSTVKPATEPKVDYNLLLESTEAQDAFWYIVNNTTFKTAPTSDKKVLISILNKAYS